MHVSWLSRGSLPKSWACKAHRVAGKVFSSFPLLAAFVRPSIGLGKRIKLQAMFLPRRGHGGTAMVPGTPGSSPREILGCPRLFL